MKQQFFHEVDGWFTVDDASFYSWLVRQVPDTATIVEVGTWKGRSLCCLLVEAANSGKEIDIVGVDTFKGSENEPPMRAEAQLCDVYADCLSNAGSVGYPFRLIRSESVAAAEQFADKSLDAVFIDGNHSEVSVWSDLCAWIPKVKAGGVIAGHDAWTPGVMAALARSGLEYSVAFGTVWHCFKE